MTGTNPLLIKNGESAVGWRRIADGPGSASAPVDDDARCASGAAEAMMAAGEAPAFHARTDKRRDERGVRRSRERGDHDLERVGIGDAKTIHLARRNLPAHQLGVNRPATAVHDRERPCGGNAGCQRRDAIPRLCGLDELAAELEDQRPRHSSPVARRSHATLKFYGAWPAAPSRGCRDN